VKPVADRAGAVWIAAERRMRAELEREGLSEGRPRNPSIIEGFSKPTLEGVGLKGSAGYHRAARAKTLLAVPERECIRLIKKLVNLGKAVTPNGLMALIRAENKTEKSSPG
jgi:hypothetical protein